MKTDGLSPGIHRIPMADYLADPAPVPSLSSGCAHRLVTESPLHAWWSHPRLGGRPSSNSSAADVGTLAHDLLLGGEGKVCEIEPSNYRSKPTKDNPEGAVPVGWTNTAIRAARDEARAKGLTPVLSGEMGAVRAMAKTARDYVDRSEIAGIFDTGESELTVIAEEGGVFFRARPDWLTADGSICLSFKTTKARVQPDAFHRLMDSMGYGFALAFYDRVLRRACPALRKVRHLILAQEQIAPYACSLFELSAAKFALERSQVERAVNLWRQCMTTNAWPGYSTRAHVVEPKPWELSEEERLLQELEEATS